MRHKKTDHPKFLFLKVPFKYVVSNYVAILIKVFKGKIDCQKGFTHLDAHSVIRVSDLFWQEDLKCSVAY